MIPIAVRLATRSFSLRRCASSASQAWARWPYCAISTASRTAWMRDEKEPAAPWVKVSLPQSPQQQPPIIKKQHYSLERRVDNNHGAQQQQYSKAEEELRYDLAVAHRLTALYGMDMLVWNHISARLPLSSPDDKDDGGGCLITPGRKMWSSMHPSDLVRTSTNVTANVIHDAIYAARPDDVRAVIHLHTPNSTAVSCLEPPGFVPMTQDAAYFYRKVAHYEWDGLSHDAAEGPALQRAISAVPGCNTLLMRNHGFACLGASVREVWILAYYFERVCEIQMKLLQCGAELRPPPPAVMEQAAADSYLPDFAPGVCEWDALCQQVSFGT